jgi:hypothetical protein
VDHVPSGWPTDCAPDDPQRDFSRSGWRAPLMATTLAMARTHLDEEAGKHAA